MPILPPKFIRINVSNVLATDVWLTDDGTGDPWIGAPYRWSCDLAVSPQFHSSHFSPTPFEYNGNDIKVGDWFSTIEGGLAVKIISIREQSIDAAKVIVEDVDRFNTFADPFGGGSGAPPAGIGFLFSMGDDGLPIMGPAPPGFFGANFQTDLLSRFVFRNQMKSYRRVYQPNHRFVVGDAIYLGGDGLYRQSRADALVDNVVGFVNTVGTPSADWFTYRPIGRVVENIAPPLPGNPGDLLYISDADPGKFTATKPVNNARPVFIKLTDTMGIQTTMSAQNPGALSYKVPTVVDGQTTFILPSEAKTVVEMSINGIENRNFSFVAPTLTFDSVATGYGVEATDEVIFVYTT